MNEALLWQPGSEFAVCETIAAYFRELWNSINARRGYDWEANPWVWAIDFKVIEGGAHAE